MVMMEDLPMWLVDEDDGDDAVKRKVDEDGIVCIGGDMPVWLLFLETGENLSARVGDDRFLSAPYWVTNGVDDDESESYWSVGHALAEARAYLATREG